MSFLSLSLLGPFHATIEGRTVSGFATDKVRALLVYLALEADIPHRRESLAALLYPDYADSDALNNFRKTLFRLRTALDAVDPTLSEQLLVISRASIQLQSSAVVLDVAEFRNALAVLSSPTRINDQDIPLLQKAVDLYRGELAAGLGLGDAQPFEEWLVLQREALHQRALHLCDVLASVYERRSDFVAAQEVARRTLALEPWREEAHSLLIRLLALNGQKSDALAQFESCCRILEEEMGVEPSDETLRLVQQVRDGTLVPPSRTEQDTPRARLHRFPMPFTSFVGRDDARHKVVTQLLEPDCRLLTLVGPGGMGKTRLGVQVALDLAATEHFQDGLYFVEGAPLNDASELPPAIASVVGLVPQGNTPALTQLQNFLRAKSVLLVVDNMEQIADAGTPLAELLATCPAIKILVTSREALHIRAEHRYALEGLSYEEGITSEAALLFGQRARQVVPHFTPTPEDEAAIVAICETVGGMPLAIEIAATWLRFYDCPTIASEINKGIDFLETEFRDVPARQRSVRAVFRQSWQLLSLTEQRVLRQLSVLRGEWTLPQALAVIKGGPRELVSLADKSLLKRTKTGRYTIHELLRQFAFERLEESGEQSDTENRHAIYFLRLLASRYEGLYSMEPRVAVVALHEELPNIRNGWRYAIDRRLWKEIQEVLPAFALFFDLSGLVREGMGLLREAVNVANRDKKQGSVRVLLLGHLAQLCYRVAEYDEVLAIADMVLADTKAEEVPEAVGLLYYLVASVRHVRGETGTDIYLDKAEHYFSQNQDRIGHARILGLRGQMLWKQGNAQDALELYTEALHIYEELGYPIGISMQLSNCGVVYQSWGEYDKALDYYHRGLEVSQRLNYPSDMARQYNNMAIVYLYKHEHEKSLAAHQQALAIDEILGNQRTIAIDRGNIGVVYERMGRYEEALALWQDSVDIAHRANLKGIEANFMCTRAELFVAIGDFERARVEMEAGIAIARGIDNRPIVAHYSGMLGSIYNRLGQHELALYTLDEALAAQAKFSMRQPLAYSMFYKATMLYDMEDMEAATQWARDAVAMQEEMGLKDSLWLRATILEVIASAMVDTNVNKRERLEALLADTQETEGQAEVLYALWNATALPDYQQRGQSLYEALVEKMPKHEYRQRLARLSKN